MFEILPKKPSTANKDSKEVIQKLKQRYFDACK